MACAERELPLIQRGMVDNCFEEGQYEYGINVLDRLRTDRYKPSPLHIRQLVFLVLYPPHPETLPSMDEVGAPRSSPRKGELQRQKDDLLPKPASRPLAIALLNAFVNTNTPESLLRGLPSYPLADYSPVFNIGSFRGGDTAVEEKYEDNSPIKDGVSAIQGQKDCWNLLKSGLLRRKAEDVHLRDDDTDTSANEIIGPCAWSLLEWLIRVFEKDEGQSKERDEAPHSTLLLRQIPAPKSKKDLRWDVEMPLNVAFACFLSQTRKSVRSEMYISSEMQFDLGARLIMLLLNLTLTKPRMLSSSHFLRLLTFRLPELQQEPLEALLARFPLSQALFKIALLESYIAHESGIFSETGRSSTKRSTVHGPRAKPKFTGKGATMSDASFSSTSSQEQDKDKNPYPIPTPENILTLLACPLPGSHKAASRTPSSSSSSISSSMKIAFAKFHLVSSLWLLCSSNRLGDSNAQLMSFVREGRLRGSVLSGFTLTGEAEGVDGGGVREYRTRTLELVGLWEASNN